MTREGKIVILTDIEQRELSKYTERFDFSEKLKNKVFLVTGSKGIIGSGVIKWLLYENQIYNVDMHIIASTRHPENIPDFIEPVDNIEFCEFGKEMEKCAGRRIDYILHAAAPTSNRVFKLQPVESLKVIVEGTDHILKIAKQHNAVILYFSSSEAYGTPSVNGPISEEYVGAIDSLNTRSCYTLGKKAAELLCRSYFEEYGVDVRIVRPTVILGLWQPYDSVKVEAEILRCVIENHNFVMKSDGSTQKSVVYSLDAVSAALTVLFRGKGGEAYNVTNPDTYCSVRERVVKTIEEFNPEIKVEFAPVDNSVSEGYLPKYKLLEDIRKIEKLGWKPFADMSYIYRIDIERFKHKA